MRKLIFGKRGTEGQTVIVYLAIGLLFAGIVLTGVVRKSLEDIKGETLEKNYIARDIALVLDSVYAVPGDLKYVYSEQDYGFVIEFKAGKVYVKKSPGDKNPGVYGFFEGNLADAKDRLSGTFIPTTDIDKPMLLVFEKKGGVVSVSAVNGISEQ